MAIRPDVHDKARMIPMAVATPFPPLNFSQTGKRWPRKAPNAETTAISGPNSAPANAANAPFNMSAKRVAAAIPFFPVRRTLVAPMLPDPMSRISPSPDNLVKTRPNGTEPME